VNAILKNADLFTSGDLLCPGRFSPLLVDFCLLPSFADSAAPRAMWKLDDEFSQMHLLETHTLALHSAAWAIDQSLQLSIHMRELISRQTQLHSITSFS